ncbi:transporter substrate-binding domain-containing protein [Pseudonocardia sp. TRM90224]|uniref:transporter substrate-binding domain-containing protein n=1 Tax=Pseudonocardia sp. TRM90224 TaxID=2812678 RepID=UPI001E40EE0A|nr:transporter substrate-binding domain-containing protein [Pseudonocardia sp. TRM90224]
MNTVNARRPFVYLCIAGVLALGSAVITGLTPPPAPPSTATQEAPPPAPAAGCEQQKVDSLRPEGPLPPPGQMPPGSTMDTILKRDRLIAGVDQGKYRLGFRNPTNGELEGSDIDVVKMIAQAIFGDPNKVQYVVLNIADRAQAAADGRVDVVVNSFTVTCERQKLVEFSTAYVAAAQKILVPTASGVTDVKQLAGQRVCTSRGSTTEVVLRKPEYNLDVVTYPNLPDCVLDLQRGRVAAVSSDDIILAGLAAQDPQTRVVGGALDEARYAVGMNKSQPDLVRFVNAVLEKGRDDGSLLASNQKWMGQQLQVVPRPAEAAYRD